MSYALKKTLKDKGYSAYYIHIYISALRSLYRYLKFNQHRLNLEANYAYNIMDGVKSEKIKPVLTLNEAEHLLNATKNNRKNIYDYRNYAIICLMLTAALSPFEVIHLKATDYKIINDKRLLMILKKQHTNPDIIQLSKGVVDAINDYLVLRKSDNPYLFISQNHTTKKGHLSRTFFYYMFKGLKHKYNLTYTGLTPHGLRHTAAYLNLLSGASLESTNKLLRHVNMASTKMYQTFYKNLKSESSTNIEAYILKESPNMQYECTFYSYYFVIS